MKFRKSYFAIAAVGLTAFIAFAQTGGSIDCTNPKYSNNSACYTQPGAGVTSSPRGDVPTASALSSSSRTIGFGEASVQKDSVQALGSGGSAPGVVKFCSPGVVVPVASSCPTPAPATQTCADGSVIAATATCPPPTPTTQTCPDGSVIASTATCPPASTKTCPDGSVIASTATCPPPAACISNPVTTSGNSCAALRGAGWTGTYSITREMATCSPNYNTEISNTSGSACTPPVTCVPIPTTMSGQSCATLKGFGWIGTYTDIVDISACNAGALISSTRDTDCTPPAIPCTSIPLTTSGNSCAAKLGAGWTGTYSITREGAVCSPSYNSEISNTSTSTCTPPPAACTSNPVTTSGNSCAILNGAGWTGTYSITREGAACSPSYNSEISNTSGASCVPPVICTSNPVTTSGNSCAAKLGAGWTGTYSITREGAVCSPSYNSEISNTSGSACTPPCVSNPVTTAGNSCAALKGAGWTGTYSITREMATCSPSYNTEISNTSGSACTPPCASNPVTTPGNSCAAKLGAGWTGTYSITREMATCSPSYNTETLNNALVACTPPCASNPVTTAGNSCAALRGAGWTGTYSITREMATCSPSYNTEISNTSGASCVPPPATCPGGVVPFGSCSANVPTRVSGQSASAPNTVPGFTGSISGLCSDAGWTNVVATCNPVVCTSNPVTTSGNSCAALKGAGWTGTYSITREMATCSPSYNTEISNTSSSCTPPCVSNPVTVNGLSCSTLKGAGWTGTYSRTTETAACMSNVGSSTDTSASTCSPPVLATTTSCSGVNLMQNWSNGTQTVLQANSTACGYVPPLPKTCSWEESQYTCSGFSGKGGSCSGSFIWKVTDTKELLPGQSASATSIPASVNTTCSGNNGAKCTRIGSGSKGSFSGIWQCAN